MQSTYNELWWVLIVGTSVIVILVFAFIATLITCNRLFKRQKNLTSSLPELSKAESTLVECQEDLHSLGAEFKAESKQKLLVEESTDKIRKVIEFFKSVIEKIR